jgi:hypothetical protein
MDTSSPYLFIFNFILICYLNVLLYAILGLKVFRVLCYSKLTFDWFPLINPYIWPQSILTSLTQPYFRFWSRLLPAINFEKSSVRISSLVALEILNSLLFLFVRISKLIILLLLENEKLLNPL